MNQRKTFPHELIGTEIKVIKSTNDADIGITGRIIDETKNTLKIETVAAKRKKSITLFKKNITFITNQSLVVEGKEISRRPEERIK
jgi:ribonuclease P protein subunit POP4